MGVKITEMPADTDIVGGELIPLVDGTTNKTATATVLKQFVIDQIEALTAGTTAPLTDSAFILQGGVMKPVPISVMAQAIVDSVWGKTANAAPAVADKMTIKTAAGVEGTVTLTVLSELVRATIEAAILDVSNLSSAGALSSSDVLLVTQGTTGKKVALSAVYTAVYAALNAYVTALAAVTAPADTDAFYVIQGGVEKKVLLSVLKGVLGTTVAPTTTTENKVPQWDSGAKTLKDGLTVQTAVRATGSAVDTALVTEKAVRDALGGGVTMAGGSEAGTVALRFGATATEGLETVVVDKVVTLGAVAGVAVFTVPAGAVLKSVQGNIQVEAVAGGTTAKVGLGVDADPNAYGESAALTANAKIDTLLAPTKLAAAVDIEVYPCASSGAIGDTAFSAGTVRVRIVYDQLNSLDNA